MTDDSHHLADAKDRSDDHSLPSGVRKPFVMAQRYVARQTPPTDTSDIERFVHLGPYEYVLPNLRGFVDSVVYFVLALWVLSSAIVAFVGVAVLSDPSLLRASFEPVVVSSAVMALLGGLFVAGYGERRTETDDIR
jgi:hypothetical protein